MKKEQRLLRRLQSHFKYGLASYQEYIEASFSLKAELAEYKYDNGKRTVQWIEPGVMYKVDCRKYEIDGQEYTQPLGVIAFQHIMCLDWDWPDPGHKTHQYITIEKYSDVKRRLEASGLTWRVYITPGGVRAFCLSESRAADKIDRKLDADPMYIKMTQKTGLYMARVVPKGERPNDWVAEYVDTIGNKPIIEELYKTVVRYHDNLIKTLRGYRQLSPEQQNIVDEHLNK